MRTIRLNDKTRIEAFLRKNPLLHVYSLGDLDDFFWPHTTWYALEEADAVREMALVYSATPPPVLLAMSDDAPAMAQLVASIVPFLPGRLYSHLTPGVKDALSNHYRLDSHGLHYKMALRDPSRLAGVDCSAVTRLAEGDLANVLQLYESAYPGNWFDPRMLQTGQYFGIRLAGELISVAGIHVYSGSYRVAALGNVTTHPAHRGRGYAQATTAKLCRSLLESVDHVIANVKADNAPALACYRKLGFEFIAPYEEYMLDAK